MNRNQMVVVKKWLGIMEFEQRMYIIPLEAWL